MCDMASRLGLPWAGMSLEAIFDEMAAMVPMLNGLNWRWLKKRVRTLSNQIEGSGPRNPAGIRSCDAA